MDVNEIPQNTVINIGSSKYHANSDCCMGKKAFKNMVLSFLGSKKNTSIKLKVQVCLECGAIFMPYQKYEKHWLDIGTYMFRCAKDGKEPYQELIKRGNFTPDPNYKPSIIDFHDVYKTPTYIMNSLRHPYQGGSMCSR